MRRSSIALLFVGLTLTGAPERLLAGDPPILVADFEVGHLGEWTSWVGNSCPDFPGVIDSVVGTIQGDSPMRVVEVVSRSDVSGFLVEEALVIQLFEEYGSTLTADDIDLATPPENNYATCGTCLLLYSGIDESQFSIEKIFFQRLGTLSISTLEPQVDGSFVAEVDATLEEVTIDEFSFESTPVPGGCRIPIRAYPVSVTLVDANP